MRLSLILGTALALASGSVSFAQSGLAPRSTARIALVPFENSPFPYRGEVPEKNRPFIDTVEGERRGHASPRGGVYWEDPTYSDRRSLLYIPQGFDPRRPALIVVYFHGNEAMLTRDVRNRQQVPRQVAESGLNAVLVAPQFAVDALDFSAGRFWQPGVFTQYLAEAAERLTRLYGDERVRGCVRARAGRHRGLQRRLPSGGVHPEIRRDRRPPARRDPARLAVRRPRQVRRLAGAADRRRSSSAPTARRRARTMRRCNGSSTDRGIGFETRLPGSLAPRQS